MKKRTTLLAAAFLCCVCFAVSSPGNAASASSGAAEAKASLPQADLQYGAQGLGFVARQAGAPSAVAAGDAVWTLTLEAKGNPKERLVLSSADQAVKVENTAEGFKLRYDGLSDPKTKARHDLAVTLEFRTSAPTFTVGGSVENKTANWIVVNFTGPVLSGLEAKLDQQPLLVPYGQGMQVRSVPKNPKAPAKRAAGWRPAGAGVVELRAAYPSYEGSMPWCVFAGKEGGLYVGCHDPEQEGKELVVRHSEKTGRFSLGYAHAIGCQPGAKWTMPATVVYAYKGTWHEAARLYRAWYDSANRAPKTIPWVQASTGWLLAILKQQNEEILWDYSTLPKLCDLADERGLSILGLFGWTEGGHDRWYPVYKPEAKMGGEEMLKKGIAEAKRRGKRVIMYYNGQLIDQDYSFWDPKGKSMTVLKGDGTYGFQSWQKYHDKPPRIHGLACFGSEEWYQSLLGMALQAERLGADGLIYDQLAMTAPMACYEAKHGHAVPKMTYGKDRRDVIQRIVDHMKNVRPDFAVMTEGLHDNLIGAVSIFHGCVMGVYSPTAAELKAMQGGPAVFAQYPDLFRYTFPEVISTIRNPRPMEDRDTVNYCCVFGFRHEIEARYAQDSAYLLKGVMPEKKDFANIAGSRPNVDAMKTATREEAARYERVVTEFQRKHEDFLWKGKFLGDTVFSIEAAPTVMAKAYESKGRIGVIVWNTAKTPAKFKLTVPGCAVTGAFAPEVGEVAPEAELPANSVRLIVCEKR